VKDEAFIRARTSLSVVAMHYTDIDLQAVSEGFIDSWYDEELNALEQAAAQATNALARLVISEALVQEHEE
jgi:GAF domain-containing protein